ncbi:manganese catalase family protein [Nocardia farcinica]|nr:manganese catalase family protein [Nocardia farcinica]MBF6255737.1 manganese catalase family protein [Nocardia farcinica]
MFIHNKDLQFEVRVDRPDPRFATLLQEQFGGANGELKAAMQYFSQAFVLRRKHPKMYDLFMDIATEEFSHLEIVGSMITMLLDGLNDDLKQANERCDWMPTVAGSDGRDEAIHQVAADPLFFALRGGGPDVGNSAGVPWSGSYVNSNGEPSVDLRSNLAAESRAKIVYEYLKQFTDDPGVQDTLSFLMTREVAHFHAEIRKILGGKAGQGRGELGRAIAGRDENIDLHHRRGHLPAVTRDRMRSMTAEVEWSAR